MSEVEKLYLEFNISDLDERYSAEALTTEIYKDIIPKVDEKYIIGVQVSPKKWPRKAQVLCAHQHSKECLLIQGLDINDQHVDFHEAGQGVIKIHNGDAPCFILNTFPKVWIAQ